MERIVRINEVLLHIRIVSNSTQEIINFEAFLRKFSEYSKILIM